MWRAEALRRRRIPLPPGLAQTKSQPEAARTEPPKTAVAIVSLRMALGVPHSDHAVRHSRTTRWRLHLLARIASFLSFNSSRRRARLAFGGTVAADITKRPGVNPEERHRTQRRHHYMRDGTLDGCQSSGNRQDDRQPA